MTLDDRMLEGGLRELRLLSSILASRLLHTLTAVSGTLSPSTAAQQHGPLSWGTTDVLNASMPCPNMTHFGSRELEFAAMRNAKLTVFADRNNGWNESP